MSNVVGNPEDPFSHVMTHVMDCPIRIKCFVVYMSSFNLISSGLEFLSKVLPA